MVQKQDDAQRIIDVKLPLTWLISTTGMIVASAVVVAINFNKQTDALNTKMDAVLTSNAEMKVQMKERDGKYEAMLRDFYLLQRAQDAHEMRLTALERPAVKGR